MRRWHARSEARIFFTTNFLCSDETTFCCPLLNFASQRASRFSILKLGASGFFVFYYSGNYFRTYIIEKRREWGIDPQGSTKQVWGNVCRTSATRLLAYCGILCFFFSFYFFPRFFLGAVLGDVYSTAYFFFWRFLSSFILLSILSKHIPFLIKRLCIVLCIVCLSHHILSYLIQPPTGISFECSYPDVYAMPISLRCWLELLYRRFLMICLDNRGKCCFTPTDEETQNQNMQNIQSDRYRGIAPIHCREVGRFLVLDQ